MSYIFRNENLWHMHCVKLKSYNELSHGVFLECYYSFLSKQTNKSQWFEELSADSIGKGTKQKSKDMRLPALRAFVLSVEFFQKKIFPEFSIVWALNVFRSLLLVFCGLPHLQVCCLLWPSISPFLVYSFFLAFATIWHTSFLLIGFCAHQSR